MSHVRGTSIVDVNTIKHIVLMWVPGSAGVALPHVSRTATQIQQTLRHLPDLLLLSRLDVVLRARGRRQASQYDRSIGVDELRIHRSIFLWTVCSSGACETRLFQIISAIMSVFSLQNEYVIQHFSKHLDESRARKWSELLPRAWLVRCHSFAFVSFVVASQVCVRRSEVALLSPSAFIR